MTKQELKEILRNHKLWIEGIGSKRADLYGADLYGVDLSGANLSKANLIGANLGFANLSNANLIDANLIDAVLSNADLSNANLSNANLIDANLIGADLSNANLSNANLSNANLRGADLSNANLSNANLRGADLRGAKNVPYFPMICPDEGGFYGYKKVRVNNTKCIAKLYIPAKAKRSSATTRKCRCEYAKVISITSLDRKQMFSEATSSYNFNLKYIVGKMVYPDKFDENRWNECSNGIHFFMQRQEAVDYKS